jgi:hypothetical protein
MKVAAPLGDLKWSWGRFAKIIATFAIVGAAVGTVAVAAVLIIGTPISRPWDLIPFIFFIGYIVGFPLALVTGAIFATIATNGRGPYRSAAVASVLAVMTFIGPAGGISNAAFVALVGLLLVSLFAATICVWLSRKWILAREK